MYVTVPVGFNRGRGWRETDCCDPLPRVRVAARNESPELGRLLLTRVISGHLCPQRGCSGVSLPSVVSRGTPRPPQQTWWLVSRAACRAGGGSGLRAAWALLACGHADRAAGAARNLRIRAPVPLHAPPRLRGLGVPGSRSVSTEWLPVTPQEAAAAHAHRCADGPSAEDTFWTV